MTTIPAGPGEHPWRFWLMLASALAVLLIVAVLLWAAVGRGNVARRHEAMLTTLERLSEAQEDALARDGRYAAHLASTGGVDTALFVPLPGLSLRFEVLGGKAWHAVVRDTMLRAGPRRCGIFRGGADASPHRAVVRPGVPACW